MFTDIHEFIKTDKNELVIIYFKNIILSLISFFYIIKKNFYFHKLIN